MLIMYCSLRIQKVFMEVILLSVRSIGRIACARYEIQLSHALLWETNSKYQKKTIKLFAFGPFMTCDAKTFWGLTYNHTFYDDGIWEIDGLADHKPPISQFGHLGRSNQHPKICILDNFKLIWKWGLYQATKTNRFVTYLFYDISFYGVEISFGLTYIFLWRMTPDGLRGLTSLLS